MKQISIFFSGGVDSLISLMIFKILKYNLKIIYILNNIINKNKIIKILKKISKILNIFIIILNLKLLYKKKIFLRFLKKYNKNYMVNPDILCNKHIKFNMVLKYSLKKINSSKISTGHYSKICNKKKYFLKNCKDKNKDQNYFIYNIKKKYIKSIIFPLGILYKVNFKNIIKNTYKTFNFSENKFSKGICFFENKNIKFLKFYIYKKIFYFLNKNKKKIKIIFIKNINKKIYFNYIFKVNKKILFLTKNFFLFKFKILSLKLKKNNFLKKKKFFSKCKINNSKFFLICKIIKIKINYILLFKNDIAYQNGQDIVFFYKKKIIKI